MDWESICPTVRVAAPQTGACAQGSQPRFTVRGVAAPRARAAAACFSRPNSNLRSRQKERAARGRTPPISNQSRPEPSNLHSTGPWAANSQSPQIICLQGHLPAPSLRPRPRDDVAQRERGRQPREVFYETSVHSSFTLSLSRTSITVPSSDSSPFRRAACRSAQSGCQGGACSGVPPKRNASRRARL